MLTIKLILVPTKRTFQYVEQSVNNVIMLKTYVSSIKSVYKALATAQSSLLLAIREVSHLLGQCLQKPLTRNSYALLRVTMQSKS